MRNLFNVTSDQRFDIKVLLSKIKNEIYSKNGSSFDPLWLKSGLEDVILTKFTGAMTQEEIAVNTSTTFLDRVSSLYLKPIYQEEPFIIDECQGTELLSKKFRSPELVLVDDHLKTSVRDAYEPSTPEIEVQPYKIEEDIYYKELFFGLSNSALDELFLTWQQVDNFLEKYPVLSNEHIVLFKRFERYYIAHLVGRYGSFFLPIEGVSKYRNFEIMIESARKAVLLTPKLDILPKI